MFESDGPQALDAPWDLDDFAGSVLHPDAMLPPVPEEPAGDAEQWLAWVGGEIDAEIAAADPVERFAREFGRPASPDELERFAPASLERAAAAQDRAVGAFRVRSGADAGWIAALLDAHEASVADLTVRFGPQVATSDRLGGFAFTNTIALLTRTDPRRVAHQVRTALTLRDRLPRTWAVFQAGDTTWPRAEKAVARFEGLAEQHWAAYDLEASRIVRDSTRVRADLRRMRERLQDDTAAQRARTTFQRRTTVLEAGPDAGAAFVVEGLATDWLPRSEAIQRLAVAAHGTDPLGRTVAQLRHDITRRVFDLGLEAFEASAAAGGEVVPARTRVQVALTITVPALGWLGRTREQAVLAGYGPIPMELAKAYAGQATSFVRVLTDPVTGVRLTMDRTARKPPTDLDRWVRIRDGRTRFPGRTTPAHLADIDHAREWQDDGFTDEDNLIVLDRPAHNAKSVGLFTDELLQNGIVRIGDPWGHVFEDPPDDPMDPAPFAPVTGTPPPVDPPCPF